MLCVLFIARQECGDARSEMLIAAMSGHKQGMTVPVVQQEERSAAQDHTQAPDQSTWNEHLTVDRFAMPVHITG